MKFFDSFKKKLKKTSGPDFDADKAYASISSEFDLKLNTSIPSINVNVSVPTPNTGQPSTGSPTISSGSIFYPLNPLNPLIPISGSHVLPGPFPLNVAYSAPTVWPDLLGRIFSEDDEWTKNKKLVYVLRLRYFNDLVYVGVLIESFSEGDDDNRSSREWALEEIPAEDFKALFPYEITGTTLIPPNYSTNTYTDDLSRLIDDVSSYCTNQDLRKKILMALILYSGCNELLTTQMCDIEDLYNNDNL